MYTSTATSASTAIPAASNPFSDAHVLSALSVSGPSP
jgi:hypothetical protein